MSRLVSVHGEPSRRQAFFSACPLWVRSTASWTDTFLHICSHSVGWYRSYRLLKINCRPRLARQALDVSQQSCTPDKERHEIPQESSVPVLSVQSPYLSIAIIVIIPLSAICCTKSSGNGSIFGVMSCQIPSIDPRPIVINAIP